MDSTLKDLRRWRRHCHIRKRLIGTQERPRLGIFRSSKHIYCQIIDDTFIDKNAKCSGKTLLACSSLTPSIAKQLVNRNGGNIKTAELIGTEIAKMALEKGIKAVAFDRGGYKYHGRVKALAEAARKAGLQF